MNNDVLPNLSSLSTASENAHEPTDEEYWKGLQYAANEAINNISTNARISVAGLPYNLYNMLFDHAALAKFTRQSENLSAVDIAEQASELTAKMNRANALKRHVDAHASTERTIKHAIVEIHKSTVKVLLRMAANNSRLPRLWGEGETLPVLPTTSMIIDDDMDTSP